MENQKVWMKKQVIELLDVATDEELSNVWHFVVHRIAGGAKSEVNRA